MKRAFKIPVSWTVVDHIVVYAETLDDAIKIFDDTEGADGKGYSLPAQPEYVDGSFNRTEDIDEIKIYNNMEVD